MAFKTFAAGILTASDVNTYLMNQTVITCTSATRPSAPNEGMTIYETDTDLWLLYNGSSWIETNRLSAWTAYTPTLSGTGWAIGNGTISGNYRRIGSMCSFNASVTFGSTSTYGGATGIRISLPITAVNNFEFNGFAIDSGAGASYAIRARTDGAGAYVTGYALQSSVGLEEAIISTKPFTWATSDQVFVAGLYEVAP